MYKPIQAFFKTENDAEKVKAELNRLKVNDIRVDKLEDAHRTLFLSPLGYGGGSAGGMGASSAGSSGGGGIFPIFARSSEGQESDDTQRDHTVECEVDEEDYQTALKIMMDNDGYVDKDTFEG